MPIFAVYHRSVTQESFSMNGHNRLIRRNHTYYLRARIPTALVYLIHKSQFWYSLKTNNYYEALEKVRKESYKVDMKINLLRALDMKIKNKQLLLEDEDIDKMVIHKLREIEDVFENHYWEINEKHFDADNLLIFNKSQEVKQAKSEQELECVELFIKEYFNDLKEDKRTHRSVIKQIGRIDKEEIPIIADKSQPREDIIKTKNALKSVEKYILNKVVAIREDSGDNFNINGRVKRCLDVINAEKNEKARRPTVSTPWGKVFDEFALEKLNNRTGENTIKQNRQCLETIFEIIGKKYVESITYKDCQKVTRSVYNIPKKWKERYKGRKLSDLLSKKNDDAISLTSVKKYLRIFKEFLIFCKDNRYIPDSFQGDIKITKRKEAIPIEAFTKEELKKIFDPLTYPRVMDTKYSYRYFIPLISIFSSLRLNEVCQIYIDDIKVDKGVWYFDITDKRKDQHLKNAQSRRIVPIHPKLLELGFIEYVNKVKEIKVDNKHPERLFYQLNYSAKNHYIQAMSQWFGRYLKKIGIDSRSKVFHSFRHTIKPYLRDAGISQEYQNAICGWIGKDIGERVYGGNIPIKKLYQEISKLKYPFLNRNIEKIANKNKIK